jgi:hypothetical protein
LNKEGQAAHKFMYCPSCGVLAQDTDRFCVRCGSPLHGAGPANVPVGLLGSTTCPVDVPSSATAVSAETSADNKLEPSNRKVETILYRWIGGLLLAAALISLWYAASQVASFAGAEVATDRIAYLVGYYFWVPIVVYFVWRSALKKRKGLGLLLFGVAFLAVSLYQSVTILHEVDDGKRFKSTLREMMLKFQQGAVLDDTQITNSGRYSPALVAVNDDYAKILSARHAFESALEAAKLETLLTPDALANPLLTDHSIATINSLRNAVDEADQSISKELDAIPHSAEALPDALRADFATGAERGTQNSKASISQFFQIERDFLNKAVELLDFANSRRGSFSLQKNRLLFGSQADLDRYNDYVSQIQDLARKEADWQKQAAATLNQAIGQLGQVN